MSPCSGGFFLGGIVHPEDLITILALQPLPREGGCYRETYRAAEKIPAGALPPRYGASRSFCTAIYYLLTPDTISALHRVKSDEIFHFYLGDPVTMLQLHPDGRAETIILGQDVAAGQQVQAVVPAGVWQGAFLNEGGTFALMGCTAAPGFEFDDFELGERDELARAFPKEAEFVRRLTRG